MLLVRGSQRLRWTQPVSCQRALTSANDITSISGTPETGDYDNAYTSVLTIAPTFNASATGAGPTGNPVPAGTPFGNKDFRTYNLNFINDYLPYSAGPSLALSMSYANGGFYYTQFLSYQDTVWHAMIFHQTELTVVSDLRRQTWERLHVRLHCRRSDRLFLRVRYLVGDRLPCQASRLWRWHHGLEGNQYDFRESLRCLYPQQPHREGERHLTHQARMRSGPAMERGDAVHICEQLS